MEYAIVLYFDEDTEAKLNNLIEELACDKTNTYMIDNRIPPHITLSLFSSSDIARIENVIDMHIRDFSQFSIIWTSLGTFIPHVLFAAPVVSEQIMNANKTVNRFIKPIAEHMDRYYQPGNWVPHTTLATKLTLESLSYAFEVAARKFMPLCGYANRIVLAECNPYKELRVWRL